MQHLGITRVAAHEAGHVIINRTIEEVDVQNPNQSLEGLRELIGCDIVELVMLDREIVMTCNEEAKYKDITGAFNFYGSGLVIAGNAIFQGGDADRFQELQEEKESLERIVKWVDPAEVPEPMFTFFVADIE